MPQHYDIPNKLLFSFTIASVASDMSLYINGFSILFSDILRDAIELSSFAVFCHKPQYLSFSRGLKYCRQYQR